MKKILIIPISILLLTACATAKAPSPETENKTVTQIEQKNVDPSFEIKEEKTEDGWIRRVGREGIVGYKGKELTLKGKVTEVEYYNEFKYFFIVSEESLKNLPAEFAKEITKNDYLKNFSLYFNDKDITDNYKGKELTVDAESIGIPSEGAPRLTLKKLL